MRSEECNKKQQIKFLIRNLFLKLITNKINNNKNGITTNGL